MDFEVAAGKAFRMGGKEYRRGEIVDVSGLPDHKVRQLMRLRFLYPLEQKEEEEEEVLVTSTK